MSRRDRVFNERSELNQVLLLVPVFLLVLFFPFTPSLRLGVCLRFAHPNEPYLSMIIIIPKQLCYLVSRKRGCAFTGLDTVCPDHETAFKV
jgi:hypothetical protein